MSPRRQRSAPAVLLPFWKRDGKFYYAEGKDLLDAIASSGRSDEDLKKRLGVGYGDLLEVLKGKRVSGWTVSHLEWALMPEHLIERTVRHSWPRTD